MDTSSTSLFERWAAGLPEGLTPRQHFVDNLACIVEELGKKAWSDEGFLDHVIRENLGWDMSTAEFVEHFPWIPDALAEARAEGMKSHALAKEYNFGICLRPLPGSVKYIVTPSLASLTDAERDAVVSVVESDNELPNA